MPHEPATGTDRMMAESLQGTAERIVYTNEATGWMVMRLRVAGRRDPVTAVGNLLSVRPGEETAPHRQVGGRFEVWRAVSC